MSDVPSEYREMLRKALKEEKAKNHVAKRPIRKPNLKKLPVRFPINKDVPEERYVVHLDDGSDDDTKNTHRKSKRKKPIDKNPSLRVDEKLQKKETINITDDEVDMPHKPLDKGDKGDNSEEDEAVDSDDFEDVDLEGTSFWDDDIENNNELNITIKQHRNAKRRSQRSSMVSGEERQFRRSMHLMHLFIMVGHGVSRNVWLSDPSLLLKIQRQIPSNLKLELKRYNDHRTKSNVTAQSKTRKLLDLLRHLMEYWQKIWTINSRMPVLYKKTWTEIKNPHLMAFSKVQRKRQKFTKQRFNQLILSHTGSRDIAAQGFVALLRSMNLPARLVFSIQPPDFTNMKKCDEVNEAKEIKPNSAGQKVTKYAPKKESSIDGLMARFRSRNAYSNKPVKTRADEEGEFSEKFGAWPVFWVEVWDKDSKKYITIDPIVKKLIEVINWKSKIEPPMNSLRNNAWYVVGYDRVGGVRDITRRYAREYNAKVRKKRITREEKWDKWWSSLLRGACSNKRIKDNRVDKFEQIEFEELGLKEGMPSNVGDFKGHPIYVLEADLKFNEILVPKISCGGLSNKGTSKKATDGFIPVYKRSNVHVVRSAKGWFMRGRVLKIGERPQKIRDKKLNKRKGRKGTEDTFQLSDNEGEDEDDNDDDGRMYAEFQTEKYTPPPVVNGIIPKNAFKNIDVYEPWMIPDGCVHIKDELSEKAAKLMGIEYAPAVVGFDFTGSRRDASAKIVGIVTLQEYEEAVNIVCEGLREMKVEEDQMREDLINLRAWRILLTKLKISKRLSYEHGEIDSDEIDQDTSDSVENEENESEEFETGGFLVGNDGGNTSSRTRSHINATDFNNNDDDYHVAGSDLSASDFDSDSNDIDMNAGGGFSIRQVDDYSEYQNKKRKKMVRNEEKGKDEYTSIFGASAGLTMDDGELVYNPDGDDEKEEHDVGSTNNDYRLDELDKEFASFVGELETEQQGGADGPEESNINDKSGDNYDGNVNYKDNQDEDYEFEYSD